MFDFSVWELAVVGGVAWLVLGPERLSKTAYKLGQWFQKAKTIQSQIRIEWDEQIKEAQLKENIAKAKAAEKKHE